MHNDETFGGKIVVLGGDFRQVRPVVPRAPPAAVLDVCLKRSDMWRNFHHLQLTQNMRANENEHAFSRWLLQIGNGLIHISLDNTAEDTIDIPEECIVNNSLVSPYRIFLETVHKKR